LGLRGEAPVGKPGDGEYLTFDEVLTRVGVRRVHLLKLDIEGTEFDAVRQMGRTGAFAAVDQLQLEVHFAQLHTNRAGATSGVRELFELFDGLEEAQLLPFSWEVNHHTAGTLKLRPNCVEYSFRRPRGLSRQQVAELLQKPRYTASAHNASRPAVVPTSARGLRKPMTTRGSDDGRMNRRRSPPRTRRGRGARLR
jgi:hypothetical protein